MSTWFAVALCIWYWLAVALIAIRPRAGGVVAMLLFTVVFSMAAQRGFWPGIWLALCQGVLFGTVSIWLHYADERQSRQRARS